MNAIERKLNEYLDRGLCDGMGDAAGQVCIEAAIALATEGEFKDSPACVHLAIRTFSIKLNDANWSTSRSRADGMRDLAFAQLGTADATFDANRFAVKLAELHIRRVLPIALRAADLIEAAERCERDGDQSAAGSAWSAARSAAESAAGSAGSAAYDSVLCVSAQCAVEAISFAREAGR